MSNRHNVFIRYHHKNDEAYKVGFMKLLISASKLTLTILAKCSEKIVSILVGTNYEMG
jgi:hypothetical protein